MSAIAKFVMVSAMGTNIATAQRQETQTKETYAVFILTVLSLSALTR